MQIHNNNCDGSNCRCATGEVRVLPYGGGGNLILCRACYEHELAFRRERNRELSGDCQFALPAWENLSVYGQEVGGLLNDTDKANLRLIAAAPDLLAACRAAYDWLSQCQAGTHQREIADECRAAIARATNGQEVGV